jgi:peptide-methionine (S)-S-oxide reductase
MSRPAAFAAPIVAVALALAGATAQAAPATDAKAYFAGGCFWCMESDFEKVAGVTEAVSGYMGGNKANPTYEETSAGTTGHAEAVEVRYDLAKVTYAQLLQIFWHNVDPTVKDRQFCDEGSQYRTAIFVRNAEERKLAESTRADVAKKLGKTIHTEIADAGAFYAAEDYHQDYYKKNPVRYKFYRTGCGRDARLKQLWGAEAGGH